ncbi:MAG: DUF1501 domain-containing protein [Verrucomicrobia bacterium]|nr:DUF1501 domain-containing protein [Verrucomicrobiota bacterium]
MQSGLATSTAFSGVSFQSALPFSLRGSEAMMPNFTDASRFNLLGVPNTSDGKLKFIPGLAGGLHLPATPKVHRQFLEQEYEKLLNALGAFSQFDFSEGGNTYRDFRVDAGHVGEAEVTDGDQDWADAWASTDGGGGYYLFPTTNNKNGGAQRMPGAASPQTSKYVVDTGAYNAANTALFNSLKGAAIFLNHTDAFIAGTEYPSPFVTIGGSPTGGFETSADQGQLTGVHPDLLRRLSWAFYSLWKYFSIYGKGGPKEVSGAKVSWDDLVIVTMSEFGRTSVENTIGGTDDGEASVMLVAGGGINGFGKPANTNGSNGGIYCCNTTGCDGPAYNNQSVNWVTGNSGTLFSSPGGYYLGRAVDFRSVLGRIIRKHLGATQNQLNTILPGYATESTEHLLTGGVCTDGVTIAGEPDFI